MNRQPAPSARALVRNIAAFAAVFALLSGEACGQSTFNLLGTDGGTQNLETPAGGGGAPTAGAPAGGFSTGGSDRGGASSRGGNNNFGGKGANGNAGGNNNFGGNSSGAAAGFGNNGGSIGDSQGGEPPCLPGESCVDGGVSCPPSVSVCTRCSSINDCGHDGLPYCDIADGHCVECLPNKDNCKPGETCDPTFMRCAKSCTLSSDCASDPSHRICAASRGVCVECTNRSDCAAVAGHASYQCAGGFCVECLDDNNCMDPSKPSCQQFQCQPKQ